MLLRVKTSVVAIALLVGVLSLSHTTLFNGAVALVGVIAAVELCRAAGVVKILPVTAAMAFLCAALPFYELLPSRFVFALPFLYLLVLVAAAVFSGNGLSFEKMCILLSAGLIIAISSFCLVGIRRFDMGSRLIYLTFMVPWVSDSLAYIFGSRFGRRKLCPKVSPNKTVEGFIAGMMGGALSVLVFGAVIWLAFGHRLSNVPILLAGATLGSLAGQMGDLFFSMCKRTFATKDFGSIFPGHGGMADRFDSVYFVAPVLYYVFLSVSVII